MAKNFYITTPIYYPSGKPHMGHAYSSIVADIFARFKRLEGYNVLFLTGTDEHGQKIEKEAKKNNKDPKIFCDELSETFRSLTKTLNLTNDDFIRTTEIRHHKSVIDIWNKLANSGDIYLDKYSGWYSVSDEAFYEEDEIEENDGKKISKSSGSTVEWVEEESYFFKLSSWQDKLIKFYEDNKKFILPESRRNEVMQFVKKGLKDLSISRTSFSWGIPVPKNNKHVIYVWLDALTNYITATNWSNKNKKQNQFDKWWPADLHMVGKDILRFHAVYWPAFLMAAELPLPKRIFAHGWWTNEGEKISKSLGNVINPIALIEEYGLDQIRYFMMREVPFGRDGDFSKTALINRINSDLANDLGNLSQRVLSIIFKNLDGKIPSVPENIQKEDHFLLNKLKELPNNVRVLINEQSFHEALRIIWYVIAEANRYVDKQAPWSLKKTDFNRMSEVLGILVEVIRGVCLLTQPFMPDASEKLLDQIKVSPKERLFSSLTDINSLSGRIIEKPEGVFPRYLKSEEA